MNTHFRLPQKVAFVIGIGSLFLAGIIPAFAGDAVAVDYATGLVAVAYSADANAPFSAVAACDKAREVCKSKGGTHPEILCDSDRTGYVSVTKGYDTVLKSWVVSAVLADTQADADRQATDETENGYPDHKVPCSIVLRYHTYGQKPGGASSAR